ncbi:hypothetical protein [Streptosporangium sp. NPDC049644]|uniref:hypothetical protein n=1 Tax=Streptosporangium sp. NPDC049644 TaxID=3155507 RepID=UPI0034330FA8
MTDNTNDAEKTPKSRAPRKPGKAAGAVTPEVAAETAGTGAAEKTPKSRAPRRPRKAAGVAPEVAADTGGAEKVQKSRRAKPAGGSAKSGRTGSAESAELAEVVEAAEAGIEPGERIEIAPGASDPGRAPASEQAERDARAEWFERADRARREERTGWAPWDRPGEREEPGGTEERGRDEQAREEWAEAGRDPLGSAAEEAFKLFDTLQQKATRELRKNLIKGTMTGFGSAFSGGGRGRERDVWEEAVSEPEEYICRACPVCRAMAAQRESGAAVTDHLMQAGTELFAAFKSAVEGLGKPAPGQRAREREREDTPVEHIDLG